jgi:hypothetical protein
VPESRKAGEWTTPTNHRHAADALCLPPRHRGPARAESRQAVIARLPLYVAFAEEVCAVIERMADQATAWLGTTGYKQTFRDRVATGLCLKIDSSFRALIDDARAGRAETMHHLKTMVESFIYFHTVVADTSPETAKHLFAKVLHEKVKFLRDNMQPGAQTRIVELERERDALLAGAPPLPSVEQLAKSYGPSLGSWYSAVYRLACEPAHLGDLQEFMPGADDRIEVGPPIKPTTAQASGLTAPANSPSI